MREVLTRALRALAVSPLNCSLILDAGGLEALTDMLCGRDQELAHQALVVLSLLSKVCYLSLLHGRVAASLPPLLPLERASEYSSQAVGTQSMLAH